MKTCKGCKQSKPDTAFQSNGEHRRATCRPCRKAARRGDFEITVDDTGLRPSSALRRILFVPDTHVPYHDRRAFALMLQAMRGWKPDIIAVLGDLADFYSVSSHAKRVDRVRTLDVEVAEVNEALSQLDALGATERHYVCGNHEERLERYLMDKAPELFNMVRIRDLFKLDDRGWHYTPYKESARIGALNLTHDVGQAGKFAFMRAMDAFQGNVVIGHTHRMGVHFEGNSKGECHVSAQFGWLGEVDKIDYMHKVAALRSWQLGFGTGTMLPDGTVFLQPIPIVNYQCVVDGVLYAS